MAFLTGTSSVPQTAISSRVSKKPPVTDDFGGVSPPFAVKKREWGLRSYPGAEEIEVIFLPWKVSVGMLTLRRSCFITARSRGGKFEPSAPTPRSSTRTAPVTATGVLDHAQGNLGRIRLGIVHSKD